MQRKQFHRTAFSLLIFVSLIAGLVQPAVARSQTPAPSHQPSAGTPVVVYADHYDLSPALRDIPASQPPAGQTLIEQPGFSLLKDKMHPFLNVKPDIDAGLQSVPGAIDALPDPLMNFDGINNRNGVAPPDTQGDIGYDPATGKKYYVQWVNLSFAVWDVTTTPSMIYGPKDGNTIFQGFEGACQTTNDGDPITLFDPIAQRWMMSQFALPNYPSGPFYQCIAVSQTANPTGAWYRYSYEWLNGAKMQTMNDYPKFGVWPDGYYMTSNQFVSGNWGGTGVAAFERDQMLVGGPARMIYFDLGVDDWGGMLPSDLDGTALPPEGTPNYFAEVHSNEWPNSPPFTQDEVQIYEFHADWANTANSTFTSVATLPLTLFNGNMCGFNRNCIPQKGTSAKLDAIADRTMYRLAYRNFNGVENLVSNLTVDSNGADRAGVHWFQLKKESGTWSLVQDSTFAPDTENRWMGSIAQDHMGNIALGYSVSSSQTYPSIRYTGRLVDDPPGTMQAEKSIFAGAYSQTATHSRWGDYSMMSVDPVDDCTFWYTTEYFGAGGIWRTRIASFKYPNCTLGPVGIVTGMVSSTKDGKPIQNSTVIVTSGNFHLSTLTDVSGFYKFTLPAGSYTVHASAYGYLTSSQDVVLAIDQLLSQNFSLGSANFYTVDGTVTDSQTGWPLYAHITISGNPVYPPPLSSELWTDPVTGHFQLTLSSEITYTFHIDAWTGGYLTTNAEVGWLTTDETDNFTLTADSSACTAPGYDTKTCTPFNGGLVVGNVDDLNTGSDLPGAQVASVSGSTITQPTIDPSQGDSFYVLFAPAGQQPITATLASYGAVPETADVVLNSTIWQDFLLPAGQLTYTPTPVEATIDAGTTLTVEVTIDNTGSQAADFEIVENNSPYLAPATGPVARTGRHLGPKNLDKKSLAGVPYYLDPPQGVDLLQAGNVLNSFPTGLSMSWGLAFDTRANDLWISDASNLTNHRYLPDGSNAGNAIDVSVLGDGWPADLAYDPLSRMLWQASGGGENCIYELDPATMSAIGKKICPQSGVSQRGLAFDPQTQTFYSGSWNDSIIYHFDLQGNLLDSADVNLAISGLAYNPATGHLFVMTNWSAAYDVYVLDVKNGYAILGGFNIDGLGDYEQAGLELDCQGRLWAPNQAQNTLLEVDSGETGVCSWMEIPWLSASPATGTIPVSGSQKLTVTLDAANLQPGVYQAQLVILNSTPYGSGVIPVTLNVAQPETALKLVAPVTARTGKPGDELAYTFTMTNTGALSDTFMISTDGNAWTTALSDTSVILAPGESIQLSAMVTIPTPWPDSKTDTVQIIVTSEADPAVTGSLAFMTTAKFYLLNLPLVVSTGP